MSAAFVFLLPGYFLYHWTANIGLIPMVLGGYSNESAILVIAWVSLWAIAALLRESVSRIRLSSTELLYVLFMLYFTTIVLLHWSTGTAPQVTVSHTAAILQITAAFLVFRLAPLGSSGLHRVLLATVLIMSLLVYKTAANDSLTLLLASNDNTKVATYQGLARVFLLTVVVITAFTPSRFKRIFHYLNAIAVLFLIGARSEVAGLLVFAATLEWMLTRRKGMALLLMPVLLAVAAVVLIDVIPQLNTWFPDNRVLFLLEFGSDGSVIERREQIQFAQNSIAASPILGAYGSYTMLGSAGSYAHNILSAWVDLGIVGMGLLVALLMRLAVIYIKQSKLKIVMPHTVAFHGLGTGLLMQTLFFLIAAKSFTDVSVAVLVGVTSALRFRMRKGNVCSAVAYHSHQITKIAIR